MIIPIVRMEEVLGAEEYGQWLEALPQEAWFDLVPLEYHACDPAAIEVWFEGRKIGYIDADFTDFIRAENGSAMFSAQRCEPPFVGRSKALFVEVPLADVCIEMPVDRLHLEPISGFQIPDLRTERRLFLGHLWPSVLSIRQVLHEAEGATSCAEDLQAALASFIDFYGRSLSGEDWACARLLQLTIQEALLCGMPDMEVVFDLACLLQESRERMQGGTKALAAILKEEMVVVRREAAGFLLEYEEAVRMGVLERDAELEAHEQWLRALPGHAYLALNDLPQLASRLYYQRLSYRDLTAVYLHLLCREHLLQMRPQEGLRKALAPTPSGRSQASAETLHVNAFPYWNTQGGCTWNNKMHAYHKMLQCVGQRGECVLIVRQAKLFMRKAYIRKDIKSVKDLCEALNRLLGTKLNVSTFTRHWRVQDES